MLPQRYPNPQYSELLRVSKAYLHRNTSCVQLLYGNKSNVIGYYRKSLLTIVVTIGLHSMKHYSNCELCLVRKDSNEMVRCLICQQNDFIAVHCKKCSLLHNSCFTHKSEYVQNKPIGFVTRFVNIPARFY